MDKILDKALRQIRKDLKEFDTIKTDEDFISSLKEIPMPESSREQIFKSHTLLYAPQYLHIYDALDWLEVLLKDDSKEFKSDVSTLIKATPVLKNVEISKSIAAKKSFEDGDILYGKNEEEDIYIIFRNTKEEDKFRFYVSFSTTTNFSFNQKEYWSNNINFQLATEFQKQFFFKSLEKKK